MYNLTVLYNVKIKCTLMLKSNCNTLKAPCTVYCILYSCIPQFLGFSIDEVIKSHLLVEWGWMRGVIYGRVGT